MGRSLNELVEVGYLSTWDVRPMSTKAGYKLVLSPGQELLDILSVSQRKQVTGKTSSACQSDEREQAAVEALLAIGVSPTRASTLAKQFDPETIVDQIEHVAFLVSRDRRGAFENPAGFVIYSIEQQIPIPAGFVTSRRKRELLDKEQRSNEEMDERYLLLSEYEQWKQQCVDREFSRRFTPEEQAVKIKSCANKTARTDANFKKMSPQQQEELIIRLLKRELQDEMDFLSFEAWAKKHDQPGLF